MTKQPKFQLFLSLKKKLNIIIFKTITQQISSLRLIFLKSHQCAFLKIIIYNESQKTICDRIPFIQNVQNRQNHKTESGFTVSQGWELRRGKQVYAKNRARVSSGVMEMWWNTARFSTCASAHFAKRTFIRTIRKHSSDRTFMRTNKKILFGTS